MEIYVEILASAAGLKTVTLRRLVTISSLSSFAVSVFHIFVLPQVCVIGFVLVRHDQGDTCLQVFSRCLPNIQYARESLSDEPAEKNKILSTAEVNLKM